MGNPALATSLEVLPEPNEGRVGGGQGLMSVNWHTGPVSSAPKQ